MGLLQATADNVYCSGSFIFASYCSLEQNLTLLENFFFKKLLDPLFTERFDFILFDLRIFVYLVQRVKIGLEHLGLGLTFGAVEVGLCFPKDARFRYGD